MDCPQLIAWEVSEKYSIPEERKGGLIFIYWSDVVSRDEGKRF